MSHDAKDIRAEYFDPLVMELELGDILEAVGDASSVVSGSNGNCTVFLESDRGLFNFAIGSVKARHPFCHVELISEKLPRVRKLAGGTQRLSLSEQADLIVESWPTIQHLFSPEELPRLEIWLSQIQKELAEQYAGES